ncbi:MULTISPECIES: Hsp20/alpha crystallin family protein [Sphingomonadaceae]|uniref:HSP20 family protein n=1 Tax=Sphingobium wenxiniae (strain DSM 21828 / CGMCC 1.7748 / JZ-1) TaxID=595605 RepID=A0A562K1U0_SPHWJ|nr:MULTISPECIES: Hsp20/alpha crystallin family protein [Sphingomonadaceae]MCF8708692.1 Hsp20/alpha crystallin family protein [Rhizorhapis sp. SPR117]OYW89018.1 MAG: heat-shock protein [Sphingobium sp. 32-64-5]SCW91588.1 HSP20 family protein [Sphingobium faniae]MBB6193705.1 HSP20 family protein [Sphingobium wenxiniae]TWH89397.1 HSP20 family protein [Sphingobium wenxiniae]
MAIRDLIPWSRQENRLPVPVSAKRDQEPDHHPLLSLHREVNRLFDDVFRGFGIPGFGGVGRDLAWPHVELGETDTEIRVTAELPGLDEKDVDITVEDGVLTLRGEKRAQVEDKERGYSERSYGRFERRIGLPQGIDRDKAAATFKNGVLTVTLPRSEAANENVRRIPVNGKAA